MTIEPKNYSTKLESNPRNLQIDNVHTLIELKEGMSIFTHRKNATNILDLHVVLENLAAINKLTNNTITPLLVDFTDFKNVSPLYTPTAKSVLMNSDFFKKRSAIAFLFNEGGQSNMNSFYSNFNQFPFKIFTNRDETMLWLKTFILN